MSQRDVSQRDIVITSQDMARLRGLLRDAWDPLGLDRPHLETLRTELDRAKVVALEEVEADVVTMNSTALVRDRDSDRATVFTLVYPEDAALETNHVSVLAPLGAAVLGFRVGDVVSFAVPSGVRSCEIVDVVYQPEAAGDLDR
jgi:regulator of nucleoside diphosphate kinase